MTPLHLAPNITLLHGDCLDFMATLADGAYSLAVVDPPYGIGDFNQSDSKYDSVEWNNSPPPVEYFNELKRVSSRQIIWGANYYNCFTHNGAALVWYKENPHPNLSDCEIASLSWGKKVDFVKVSHQKTITKENKSNRIHPCQKPVDLYRLILQNYAKPGDTILDTHLGSGSSAIAAWEMGYTFTGIEIDRDYFDAAVERIRKRMSQPYLPGIVQPKAEQASLF